jgi:hypothetical protein
VKESETMSRGSRVNGVSGSDSEGNLEIYINTWLFSQRKKSGNNGRERGRRYSSRGDHGELAAFDFVCAHAEGVQACGQQAQLQPTHDS